MKYKVSTYAVFIEMVCYKCKLNGIEVVLREEVGEFNYNPIEVCSSPKKLRIGLS